jgi:peptidoglycan hydrolase-like protein with peptidoglycan-binding domain
MTYSIDAAIRAASGEVGYRETGTNLTKYNRWLGKIGGYPHDGYGYPWCASFQAWVADQAGGRANEDYPRTAGCAAAVAWFKKHRRWSSTPRAGDWVFYGPGGSTHVELVVHVTGSTITTIGGNTSGSLNGRYYNGDGVYKKTIARSSGRIYGYGRPTAKPYKWDGKAPAPMLEKGDAGPRVLDLQHALLHLGYRLPKFGADGDYGDEVGNAVGAFQRAHGLDDDEVYGPKTAAAMRAALAGATTKPDQKPDQGDEEDDMARFYYGQLNEGAGAVTAVSVHSGDITWAGFLAGAGQPDVRLRVTAHYSDGTDAAHEVTATATGKKATVKLAATGKTVDGFSVERLDDGAAAVGWDAT